MFTRTDYDKLPKVCFCERCGVWSAIPHRHWGQAPTVARPEIGA